MGLEVVYRDSTATLMGVYRDFPDMPLAGARAIADARLERMMKATALWMIKDAFSKLVVAPYEI